MDILLRCPRPIASFYGSVLNFYGNKNQIQNTQFGVLSGKMVYFDQVESLKEYHMWADELMVKSGLLNVNFSRNLIIDASGNGPDSHEKFRQTLNDALLADLNVTLFDENFPPWVFANILVKLSNICMEKIRDITWKNVAFLISREFIETCSSKEILQIADILSHSSKLVIIISDFAETDEDFLNKLNEKRRHQEDFEEENFSTESEILTEKTQKIQFPENNIRDAIIDNIIEGNTDYVVNTIQWETKRQSMTCGFVKPKFTKSEYISIANNLGDHLALKVIFSIESINHMAIKGQKFDLNDLIDVAVMANSSEAVSLFDSYRKQGPNLSLTEIDHNNHDYKNLKLAAISGNKKFLTQFLDITLLKKNNKDLLEDLDQKLLKPIMLACEFGQEKFLTEILHICRGLNNNYGIDLNLQDSNYNSFLMVSSFYNFAEVADVLFKHWGISGIN